MGENVTLDTCVWARWYTWSCWVPGGVVSRIDKILLFWPYWGLCVRNIPETQLSFLLSRPFILFIRFRRRITGFHLGELKNYRLYVEIHGCRTGILAFDLEGAGARFNIGKPLNAAFFLNNHTPLLGLAQKKGRRLRYGRAKK